MEQLISRYLQKVNSVSTAFVRSIMKDINWNARLIGIKGARGTGKTTLILQYIKLNLAEELDKVLYVSLDSLWFTQNDLPGLVDEFVRKGGKHIFLDEVHKYTGWSQALKNFYDDYPELKIVFTGSSLLEILNARADLSRRAVTYFMQGLSFREYLSMETNQTFDKITLDSLLDHHVNHVKGVLEKVKPFRYFESYLRSGYYPFYKESPELYETRLSEIINMILEIELPLLRGIDIAYVNKIKQLLLIISESAPFIPNISKLSSRININRTTLLTYLGYLDESGLLKNLYKEAKGISRLQKPDKIYLENTNLAYIFNNAYPEKGNLRETYFINQVSYNHNTTYTEHGDSLVEGKYTFEIGGKNKKKSQIKGLQDAWIVKDDLEYGFQNTVPLWLFGFLY